MNIGHPAHIDQITPLFSALFLKCLSNTGPQGGLRGNFRYHPSVARFRQRNLPQSQKPRRCQRRLEGQHLGFSSNCQWVRQIFSRPQRRWRGQHSRLGLCYTAIQSVNIAPFFTILVPTKRIRNDVRETIFSIFHLKSDIMNQ